MQIVLFQKDIVWADPQANRKRMREAVVSAPDADLYVFPEMFSTGFVTSPEGVAEEAPSETLELMKELSRARGAAITGSIALHENGRYYNRLYFVKPDGSVVHYDKHHLFTYSGEDKTFTAGHDRVIVEWKGVRFLINVCYDLRFPVWTRNRGDYDAAIYVASWPVSRRFAWDLLVRARAIENQCYVIAVNRVGNDPSCDYDGGSVMVNPYGELEAACSDGVEDCVKVFLDMEELKRFRCKFPVLNDQDDFSIKSL